MGYLIDTGIIIALERGALPKETLEAKTGQDLAFLSVVTLSELWHGFHRAVSPARALQRSVFIQGIHRLYPTLEIDEQVAIEHSRVWAELESDGRMIGLHDLWIAATALAYDLTVVTRNEREFRRVNGLRVETW